VVKRSSKVGNHTQWYDIASHRFARQEAEEEAYEKGSMEATVCPE